MKHYMDIEWPEKRRGPFPFDYMAEIWDKLTLEDEIRMRTHSGLSEAS